MAIAYLITAYHQPAHLVRLVRRLDGAGVVFALHIDAKAQAPVYDSVQAGLADMGNVTFLPRRKILWGAPGLAETAIAGLRVLMRDDPAVEHVIWLSGQDYPLASPAVIRAFLEGRAGTSFIESRPLAREDSGQYGLHRVRYWWFWILGKPLPFPLAWRFRNPIATPLWNAFVRLIPARRRWRPGVPPNGGSGWWVLSRRHVQEMLDYMDVHPRFLPFFRRVFISDEIVFATLIAATQWPEAVVNDNLRYIVFERGSPHPNVLRTSDLPAMLGSGKLFARKFDPGIDHDVLDRLDEAIDALDAQAMHAVGAAVPVDFR